MKKTLLRSATIVCWFLMVGVIGWAKLWSMLPEHWRPGAPLRLEHPLTAVTRVKLAQLHDNPEECLDLLAETPADTLDYLALEDYTPVENCPLENVVRVRSTGVEFNAPFTLSCPLLVRWMMFEQQALQPLALEYQGSPVTNVEHFGTFACRNIYGRERARRSEHASANAFDVAGFRFANGEEANVLEDWRAEDESVNSQFLHEVHNEACKYFGTVLGPDYNQPHENHFHLDSSRFDLCR